MRSQRDGVLSPPGRADALLVAVRSFVADEVLPNVAGWDREDVIPESAFRRLMDLGLMGAMVPHEYGGQGLTVQDLMPVWRILSQGWISLAAQSTRRAWRPRCWSSTERRSSAKLAEAAWRG